MNTNLKIREFGNLKMNTIEGEVNILLNMFDYTYSTLYGGLLFGRLNFWRKILSLTITSCCLFLNSFLRAGSKVCKRVI